MAFAGGLLTFALSWVTWHIADRPTSEFPSWLEAWATVVGVGAAIVAGFYAARAFRLEFDRERRFEQTQRANQAVLISAWPSRLLFEVGGLDNDGYDEYLGIAGGLVQVRNASDLLVTHVHLEAFAHLSGVSGPTVDVGNAQLRHLPPGETQEVRVRVDRIIPFAAFKGDASRTSDYELALRVSFFDSAGNRWTREENGQLYIDVEAPVAPYAD